MRSADVNPKFIWVSDEPSPPGRWDLRLLGWTMVPAKDPATPPEERSNETPIPRLVDGRLGQVRLDISGEGRRSLIEPALTIVIGVDDPDDRAQLLASGVGEAVPMATSVVELGARLTRLVAAQNSIPRLRKAGPVTLDLFHRDGRIEDRWLALHPREFGLLWRLAETPDERVSARELLSDVWRLDHVPETNSLQVHVSRLRAKLAISQAAWLIETDPQGGYRLGSNQQSSFFAFSKLRQETLDRPDDIGNDDTNHSVIMRKEDADK